MLYNLVKCKYWIVTLGKILPFFWSFWYCLSSCFAPTCTAGLKISVMLCSVKSKNIIKSVMPDFEAIVSKIWENSIQLLYSKTWTCAPLTHSSHLFPKRFNYFKSDLLEVVNASHLPPHHFFKSLKTAVVKPLHKKAIWKTQIEKI